MIRNFTILPRVGGLFALLCLAAGTAVITRAEGDNGSVETRGGHWIVGTWYLQLDSEPYGLPPGFPLSRIAIFTSDGTYQGQDAGDFGNPNFTPQQSTQYGAWQTSEGNTVILTTLSFQAELYTGDVTLWGRGQFEFHRTDDPDFVSGHVTGAILFCDDSLPVPTPLACPNPIESADELIVIPPFDIPITLTRLRPGN
jgi:hypothetical protein